MGSIDVGGRLAADKTPVAGKARSYSTIWVLVGALAVSSALLVFGQRDFAVQAEQLERTPVMDRLIPRFWQNGKGCKLSNTPT